MSVFNPELMKQSTYAQVGSTEVVLIPFGEYEAEIKSYELGTWESQEKGTSGGKIDWTFALSDPDGKMKEEIGREPTSRCNYFLDLTEEGGLDFGKGKNVMLNRLLVAAGIKDGQPWSFDSLLGRRVKVKVRHSVNKKTGNPFAEVESYRAL